MAVGILALQGGVSEHATALAELGMASRPVRRPGDLEGLAGLVMPGGESTTLSLLLQSSGLFEPLSQALTDGLPAFGTCAGLVLLAREVTDGRPDQRGFGLLDVAVRRNAYGRQAQSFEADVRTPLAPGPAGAEGRMPAVFIRAPAIETVGPGVEELGWLDAEDGARPVAVGQGPLLAAAFHPELTADRRLHRRFVDLVQQAGTRVRTAPGGATRGR